MKTRLNKTLQIMLLASGIIVLSIFTSCNQDNKTPDHEPMNMETEQSNSTIVRQGMIDLMMIDENKDGMVYQDMMDWNVISDKAGKCPLCKMTLKEVSVEKAKENLVKNDFKVKDN
jgi:hypothetical protein